MKKSAELLGFHKASAPETLRNLTRSLHRKPREPHQASSPPKLPEPHQVPAPKPSRTEPRICTITEHLHWTLPEPLTRYLHRNPLEPHTTLRRLSSYLHLSGTFLLLGKESAAKAPFATVMQPLQCNLRPSDAKPNSMTLAAAAARNLDAAIPLRSADTELQSAR